MSLSDDLTKKNCEKAFGEGRKAGRSGSFVDDFVHGLGEVIGTVVPSTKEHQSSNAGYRVGKLERGMGRDKTGDSEGSCNSYGDSGDNGTSIDSISGGRSTHGLLFYAYFGTAGTLWIIYFLIIIAAFIEIIPKQTAANLNIQLKNLVERPEGIALMLFFSVGLVVTGFYIVLFDLVVLLPLSIVVGIISIVPLVGIIGGLPLLVFYYCWVFRKMKDKLKKW